MIVIYLACPPPDASSHHQAMSTATTTMVPNTTNEAYEARDVSSRAPLVNVDGHHYHHGTQHDEWGLWGSRCVVSSPPGKCFFFLFHCTNYYSYLDYMYGERQLAPPPTTANVATDDDTQYHTNGSRCVSSPGMFFFFFYFVVLIIILT